MTLKEIEARLAEIDTELDKPDADVDKLGVEVKTLKEDRTKLMDDVEKRKALRNDIATGKLGTVIEESPEKRAKEKAEDKFDTTEYRTAFMKYIQRGTPIPREMRAGDENTLTTDVTAVIPTTIVNKIVESMESIGMILPLVTRTAYASGVNIPTATVKPTATWVNEGAGSDRQKKTVTNYISFSHFKLRCEISMSAEVGAMALAVFESTFVRQVSEAMVKAIEAKIVSTDAGTTNPKGILSETPVTGQALTAKTLTYETLVSAEAVLPQAYEGGAIWCMTKKTFMSFIGMTDANGQPIARINYGINGKPDRTLLGRSVVLCGDYLDSFSSTLTAGKIFAFLFSFSDYILNTVYDMGIQRKQDWDTEDYLTKAVMSCDGKVVDKNSLVTIAKS